MEKYLKVRVVSFAYKCGVPQDDNGNGGGFVFDCRLLPNPGRLPEYCELTGKDAAVVHFLENETEVKSFIDNVKSIVFQAVGTYLDRDFKSLLICFGCTGGQHRSVYISETIARMIKENFPVEVHLEHRELSEKTVMA
jgi:RNase adaptor protein for sRNA GlmZ degradation